MALSLSSFLSLPSPQSLGSSCDAIDALPDLELQTLLSSLPALATTTRSGDATSDIAETVFPTALAPSLSSAPSSVTESMAAASPSSSLSSQYYSVKADLVYKLYTDSRNNIELSHNQLLYLADPNSAEYEALAELFCIPLHCRGNKFLQVNLSRARAIASKFIDVLESRGSEEGNHDNPYLCFIKGAYFDDLKCNYSESFTWYQRCAMLGNSTGMNNLGFCYFIGKGCRRSFKEALSLYQRAADSDNVLAQANLGYCYYSGKGTPENMPLAVFWFRKAADNGNAFGQNRLGFCYYKGEGVEKDYKEAVRLFLLSADQGAAESQYYLGDCYYFGRGVDKDFKESIKYYKLSADNGHHDALNELGNLYYKGEGVEKDRFEAVRLWRISARLARL